MNREELIRNYLRLIQEAKENIERYRRELSSLGYNGLS